MFVPVKNNVKFDEKYLFERELPLGLKVQVEKEAKIKPDTVIAIGEMYEEKMRIDVAGYLGVKVKDTSKYVVCLNGERVEKGDTLAYRKGGLMGREKRLIAPNSGVVNLSQIDSGILIILGEAVEKTLSSGLEGKVVNIIKGRRIGVECKVVRIMPFVIYGKSVQGNIYFVKSFGAGIESNSIYKNSIVILDYLPEAEYVKNLALAGVNGIIVSSITDSLRHFVTNEGLFGATICSLDGFGEIVYDQSLKTIFSANDGHFGMIDSRNGELIFTNTTNAKELKCNHQIEVLNLGDKVQCLEGKEVISYGEVIEIGSEFVKVKTDKGNTIEVHNLNLLKIN